jgi:hypothetical protein
VQSKGDILQQYGFPRNYPAYVEGEELLQQLRQTMAPEMCRATAKLTKEYLEDILEKVGGRQGSATPTKRKEDGGLLRSPAKRVRLEG